MPSLYHRRGRAWTSCHHRGMMSLTKHPNALFYYSIEKEKDEMTAESQKIIKIFFCYAHEDKMLRDELEKHLEPLKRSKQITAWHDRDIQPGTEWKREIDYHLNLSHIVLLLISPNFILSDYCYGVEMQRALERHEAGEARVIP